MKYVQSFVFTVQSKLFEPSIFRHSRFFEPVVVILLDLLQSDFTSYFLNKIQFSKRLKKIGIPL